MAVGDGVPAQEAASQSQPSVIVPVASTPSGSGVVRHPERDVRMRPAPQAGPAAAMSPRAQASSDMSVGNLEEVPLELQSLSFSEYCNPGCFTELAGEFGMLPGLVADVNLKDQESQVAMDMTSKANQQRYMAALEDQDPYLVISAPPCTRSSQLQSMNRNKYKDPVRQKKLEEEDRILLRCVLGFSTRICGMLIHGVMSASRR